MSRTGEIRARVPNFPVDGKRGKGMRREASGIRSKGGRMRGTVANAAKGNMAGFPEGLLFGTGMC